MWTHRDCTSSFKDANDIIAATSERCADPDKQVNLNRELTVP
jgi:hypothetical protein